MIEVIPRLIKIWNVSSRVISSSWTMGAAISESERLKLATSMTIINEAEQLVYTHVP